MKHHRYRNNYADEDNSGIEVPYSGWLTCILGSIFIFFLGMRFAAKRAPLLPIILYRLLRGTAYRW